jgi:hypothetical protein
MMAKLARPGLSTVVLAVAILPGLGCRRMMARATHEVAPSTPALAARSSVPAPVGGRRFSFDSPLAGVVDPWSWPRAQGASERERAIEDIGPYEPEDRDDTGARLVNSNAHHWTTRVGIAWTRDVDIDFDREPVDLDGDGAADTRISRHIHARGGILANPELFGLTRTPDDPRGTVGRISISTGILGLREALTPDGRPSGQIGMTCFLCHGAADPDGGQPVLGLPATAFDYGLLLATAAVLRDDDRAAMAYRRTRGFPDGRTVRARLLLAGPGRQDLTGEFGLDITVPGTHSFFYPGAARVRQGTSGIVNPISVPGVWMTGGLEVQNWSGSEMASATWVNRLVALAGRPGVRTDVGELLRALQLPSLPGTSEDAPTDWASAWAATPFFAALAPLRRALLFDLRKLGTLGLQQDSYPALLWADALRGRARLSGGALVAIPAMYAAHALRHVTEAAAQTWQDNGLALAKRSLADAPRVRAIARGRALFADRIVGEIANLQILKEAPAIYAAAQLAGPVLAPLDPALPGVIAVRCADCHNASPGGAKVSLAQMTPPLGRCGHCHHSHLPFGDPDDGDGDDDDGAARRPLAELPVPASAQAEVALCRSCHDQHRDFAPVAFSSSALLPFDANQNGKSQDDEAADARAGGIGTEALLAFDVPLPRRPLSGFSVAIPRLAAVRAVAPVHTARLGAGWVRVAPLVALRASAPYLHNGSVPTLRALLEPPARRPMSFTLGKTGFRFDTRLPGNRNIGHAFGTQLSPAEKSDLVAFLESL